MQEFRLIVLILFGEYYREPLKGGSPFQNFDFMKYLLFSKSTNLKEIGIYPQSQSWYAREDYHVDAPYSFRKLEKYRKSSSNIKFPIFKLHGKAKLTDMLSIPSVGMGMFISNKFKNIIQPFSIPIIEEYKVFVDVRKKDYHYNFIHFIESCEKYINFSNSIFCMENFIYGNKTENISFDNFDHYMSCQRKLEIGSNYVTRKIEIITEDAPDILVFSGTTNTLISEKLANELINQKITGIRIQPLSEQRSSSKIDFTFV